MPPKKGKRAKDEESDEESKEEEEEEEVTPKRKRAKGKESQKELEADLGIEEKRDVVLGDGRFGKPEILISSWNVNGLRSVLKKGELLKYLKETDPDILCLNETKINAESFRKEGIEKEFPAGYNHYWAFCRVKAGYSGVAIISKVAPISAHFAIGVTKHDLEGRLVTLEFERFYLVACYVPNAGQKLDRLGYRTDEWDPEFRAYLCKLRDKKHVVLCGDLNVSHKEIDIFDTKGKEKQAGYTPQERAQFTKLLEEGFVDSFRQLHPDKKQFSYWTARANARKENKGWRLDYFVVDKQGMSLVVDSRINDAVHGSDHCPIELVMRP
eukprot:TRINITY_DN12943_c0_g1_i1.p1 TRINITY_DN12943_c0_g1~~TRINITY_DN12943_c0_g1_i1.p1  ORF type:complete len:326 (-),score=88.83 TRINITY_DN12943_c0_g1_i1:133-1110(-)